MLEETNEDLLQKQAQIIEEQNEIICEQKLKIQELETLYRRKSEEYEEISDAFFWKITKPARLTLDILKGGYAGPDALHLAQKGYNSIRQYGIRVTWARMLNKIHTIRESRKLSKQPLFTEEELAAQRKASFSQKIKISVVVPLYNTPKTFLREMIQSVLSQTYSDWELCMADGSDEEHPEVQKICMDFVRKDQRIRYCRLKRNLGISGNTNECLKMATGDYIGLFDHDDLLHPAALYEVMKAICEKGADFIYTDENTFRKKTTDAYLPHFKPSYAPDNLCGNNYICHFTVFKKSLLDEVGVFDPECDGSQDHDMILRLTEKAKCIAHIPEILYYWRAHAGSVAEDVGIKPYVTEAGVRSVQRHLLRLGIKGTVSPVKPGMTIYRIRYELKEKPRISILIPNYEHLTDLNNCIHSILDKTTYQDYEIIIVENNSSSTELFNYYSRIQKEHDNIHVIDYGKHPFNYSAINNMGAGYCTGKYIVLLNNDTEIITGNWLQEMLMFAQREDVGAVGAKLFYPDGTIQHGGVGIGLGGAAAHYCAGVNRHNPGYMGRLIYAQNMSAVTGACMMIPRHVWDEMKGLDEKLAVNYNDIDLCLRIRQAGYHIVWTPFAELFHYESKSRGLLDSPEKKTHFYEERDMFQKRWRSVLKEGDPYYNPNFTLDRNDFAIEPCALQQDARINH